MPPWVRAGLVAAVLSGAPSTAIALRRGDDVLASTEAVGRVFITGRDKGWARVAVGALAHLALSLLWARVLQRVLRDMQGTTASVVAGAACGAGIALVDLGMIGRLLPPIRELRGAPLVADHLAFGAVASWVLRREGRPGRLRRKGSA